MSRCYEIHCDGAPCAERAVEETLAGPQIVSLGKKVWGTDPEACRRLAEQNGWRLGATPDEPDLCPGCQKPEPS